MTTEHQFLERLPRKRARWARPWFRMTVVIRTALYSALAAAVIWQWHGRHYDAFCRTDLVVALRAPSRVPADGGVPVVVRTHALGSVLVPCRLDWTGFDADGRVVTNGRKDSSGDATIVVGPPVREIEVAALGAHGERRARLRLGAADAPEQHQFVWATSGDVEVMHALYRATDRAAWFALGLTRLGLLLILVVGTAELSAWTMRLWMRSYLRRPAPARLQILAAIVGAAPLVSFLLWNSTGVGFRGEWREWIDLQFILRDLGRPWAGD